MEQELKLKKVDISKAENGFIYLSVRARGNKPDRFEILVKIEGHLFKLGGNEKKSMIYFADTSSINQDNSYAFFQLGEFDFNLNIT